MLSSGRCSHMLLLQALRLKEDVEVDVMSQLRSATGAVEELKTAEVSWRVCFLRFDFFKSFWFVPTISSGKIRIWNKSFRAWGLEGLSVRKSSWRHWCILQQDHTQDAVVRIHSFQHWAIDALNYLILLGMDSEMLFLVACVCLLAGLQRGETFKIDQLDGLNGSKIQIIGAKSCKELVTPII